MAEPALTEDTAPRPPRSVVRSRWFWIGAAVVAAGRALWELADRATLVDTIRKGAPELSQDQVDANVSGAIMVSVLWAAVLLMLYVLLANRMLIGRNWARIAMLVLGFFEVIGGAVGLGAVAAGMATRLGFHITGPSIAFAVVSRLLEAVAIGFLLHPTATQYFKLMSIRRPRPPIHPHSPTF
ncbi:hypothetical protein D5S17_16000 [Pseudonocardiaceae bacterium YIM PH 21723]|nr:hypothetical protein D5S17_16000 [Pseudonocardiaceae bacterium YIM PH 21723]